MVWSFVKNVLILGSFALLTLFVLTSFSPGESDTNPQNITVVDGEQVYEDVDSNYTKKVENDELDPPENLVGGPNEVLRINNTGFNFRVMELTVGDSITVSNQDNRTHGLVIEGMGITREVGSGNEINIDISEGGVYSLESNLFEEERVSLDINAR